MQAKIHNSGVSENDDNDDDDMLRFSARSVADVIRGSLCNKRSQNKRLKRYSCNMTKGQKCLSSEFRENSPVFSL